MLYEVITTIVEATRRNWFHIEGNEPRTTQSGLQAGGDVPRGLPSTITRSECEEDVSANLLSRGGTIDIQGWDTELEVVKRETGDEEPIV